MEFNTNEIVITTTNIDNNYKDNVYVCVYVC